MKKKLLALLVALGGLSAAQTVKYPVTIPHSSGQTVIPKKPLRVVALGPHALDLLLSLGVQPVGYGEATDFIKTPNFGKPLQDIKVLGSRVTSKPINVGDRFKPNLEILASVKPDLIVGEDYAADAYKNLSAIAPTLLFRGIDHNDWQKSLPLLAKALDRQSNYANVLKSYNQGIEAAKAQLGPKLKGKRVLVAWTGGASSGNTFTLSGSDDWTGGLLHDMGLNVLEGDKKDAVVSIEGLADLNPDVMFVLPSGTHTAAKARKEWYTNPITAGLKATKAGQVYFFDYHLFRRVRGPIAARLVERQVLREIK